MTINIDKDLPEVVIRILWDFYPSEDTQVLRIFRDYTTEVKSIDLEENQTPDFRWGEYILTPIMYSDLAVGQYTYDIYDYNNDFILTQGTLKVYKKKEEPIEYKSTDEFISYEED